MSSKFFDNPITQVRLAARKTGEQFAASLNISVSAVRNMERGRLGVSAVTAEKIFMVYGAAPKSLLGKASQAVSAMRDEPYTFEVYQEWLRLTVIPPEKQKEMLENQLRRLRWLIEAATMNGSLFATDFQISRAIELIAKQGRLEGLIRTLIRNSGSDESWWNFDAGTLGVVDHVVAKLEKESKGREGNGENRVKTDVGPA